MSGNGGTRFEEIISGSHTGYVRISPLADYFTDPYRFFRWARAEAPVLHVPEINCWAVACYNDIVSIFRDTETFSSANVRQPVVPFGPKAMEVYESVGIELRPTLVDEDPPTHRPHRRIFGAGLSARLIQQLEPKVRATVSRYIDSFVDDGSTDLLNRLMIPTASSLLFHFLGGADEDFDLADWPFGMEGVQIGESSIEVAQVSFVEVMAHQWSFSDRLIQAALENPGDNYLGDMVRLRRADPSLFTDNYLHNIVFGMLSAGVDNQSHTLANGIRAMLNERTPWERLCADPGLIPNAVEEILRFATALMVFPARLTTREAEVGGQRIPAGSHIRLLLASGNRDETVFPDGETLDIDRGNAEDHLSFGCGAHYCIGAPFARLQMKVILEELTRRLPHIRLATAVPEAFRTLAFSGLKRLPVEWD